MQSMDIFMPEQLWEGFDEAIPSFVLVHRFRVPVVAQEPLGWTLADFLRDATRPQNACRDPDCLAVLKPHYLR